MAWTEDLLRVQIWMALVTADVSATRIHLQIFPLITSDNIYNWESFYSSTSNDWVLTLTNQQTVFWPSLCGSVPSEDRKWFRHPSVGYAEPTNGRPALPPPRSGKTPNGLLHQLITLLDKKALFAERGVWTVQIMRQEVIPVACKTGRQVPSSLKHLRGATTTHVTGLGPQLSHICDSLCQLLLPSRPSK